MGADTGEREVLMFDTPVADCLAVVIDPNHARFCEEAAITYHDWREGGEVGVVFDDGKMAHLADGMMKGELVVPQVKIVKKRPTHWGMSNQFMNIRDALRALASIIRDERYAKEFRQAARDEFWRLVDGASQLN